MKTQIKTSLLACAFLLASTAEAAKILVSTQERDEAIASAVVWKHPGQISSKDMSVGNGKKFQQDQTVECTFFDGFYKEVADTGKTDKFWCATDDKDPLKTKIKIRYGEDNGEVFAEVIASRLFWALGFFADDVYPVHVNCYNCPNEPWKFLNYLAFAKGESSQKRPPIDMRSSQGRREAIEKAIAYVQDDQRQRLARGESYKTVYSPALTESKYNAEAIEPANARTAEGVGLDELAKIDATKGGSSKAEIDALKLLVAFVKHGDSKPSNQRLACPKDQIETLANGKVKCKQAHFVMHDLGATFGTGAYEILGISAGIDQSSKMSYAAWKSLPVWKNKATCQAEIGDALNGTLKNPIISEAGRSFLANLISEITDQQIVDLFKAAKVELRKDSAQQASLAEWVELFKQKRNEILNTRCPQ
jgi:hypothetical protein